MKEKAFDGTKWIFFLCLLPLILSGCNGIVRYKTLGFRESATAQLYEHTSGYLAPLAIPAGAMIDSGILVADTVANPFCALIMVSRGPDPGASFHPVVILVLPVYWCFTPVAMAALPFLGRDFYISTYGDAGHWLQPQEETCEGQQAETAEPPKKE